MNKFMAEFSDLFSFLEENQFAIVFSVISLVVAIIALVAAKPLETKSFRSEAMLTLFNIMNGEDVKKDKKTLADQWNILKETNEEGVPSKPEIKAKFENFKKQTMNVMEAYNQVGALYELNLIDKKHFRTVYGGNFVRTYNLSKEHIEWHRGNGVKEYCIHFENVAEDLMEDKLFKKGIKADVYNDKST